MGCSWLELAHGQERLWMMVESESVQRTGIAICEPSVGGFNPAAAHAFC